MWCRRCVGGVVILNSDQRVLFWRPHFLAKFVLDFTSERLGIWRGGVRRKQLILVLRKFSFNKIRYNQWKVVKAYAWMIAPTSFGKSLVFWSLESFLSLFTSSALPRSSFICSYDDKNCFLISRIISNKIVVISGAVSTNDIRQTAFSVEFRAPKDFQIHAQVEFWRLRRSLALVSKVDLTNWRQFFMRLSCYWSWISS